MKPIITIHSCHKYADLRQAQRETWVAKWRHLIDIKWFVGRPAGDEPDVVYVDCADDWNSLGIKTSAEARYTRTNGYTHMFKCDDDTFVHVPRLLASGFEKWDYTGRCIALPSNIPYMQGGAGYWIAGRAIDLVAELRDEWWLKPNTMHHHSEDIGVGLVTRFHKVGGKNDLRYFHGTTLKLGHPAPGNELITAHKCNRWMHEHFTRLNA